MTSWVDRTLEETHDAIINKGGTAIGAHVCKNSWHIFPSRNARINRLRKEIDNYLAAIELAGIEKFWGPTDCRPSVEAVYADLGVVGGSVVSWIKPGHILMALPGTGGAFGAISVIEAAEREAFKADNRKKLSAAAGAERHLAIYVRGTRPSWVALLDFEPPPDVPHLPPEVTDILVFSEAYREHKYVVRRASASWPWEKLKPTLDILE